VLDALHGLIPLRATCGGFSDLDQQPSRKEYALPEFLEFGVDGFNQFLAVDRLLQQRFEDGQQDLRFLQSKGALGHRVESILVDYATAGIRQSAVGIRSEPCLNSVDHEYC